MLKEQMTMLSRKHDLITNQVERMNALKKEGHISGYEYENVLSQELAVRIDIQNLSISKISKENLIEQMQNENDFLLYENKNRIDNLKEKSSDINQKFSQLNGRKSYIIKSPRAGIINNLQAIEGRELSLAEIEEVQGGWEVSITAKAELPKVTVTNTNSSAGTTSGTIGGGTYSGSVTIRGGSGSSTGSSSSGSSSSAPSRTDPTDDKKK